MANISTIARLTVQQGLAPNQTRDGFWAKGFAVDDLILITARALSTAQEIAGGISLSRGLFVENVGYETRIVHGVSNYYVWCSVRNGGPTFVPIYVIHFAKVSSVF